MSNASLLHNSGVAAACSDDEFSLASSLTTAAPDCVRTFAIFVLSKSSFTFDSRIVVSSSLILASFFFSLVFVSSSLRCRFRMVSCSTLICLFFSSVSDRSSESSSILISSCGRLTGSAYEVMQGKREFYFIFLFLSFMNGKFWKSRVSDHFLSCRDENRILVVLYILNFMKNKNFKSKLCHWSYLNETFLSFLQRTFFFRFSSLDFLQLLGPSSSDISISSFSSNESSSCTDRTSWTKKLANFECTKRQLVELKSQKKKIFTVQCPPFPKRLSNSTLPKRTHLEALHPLQSTHQCFLCVKCQLWFKKVLLKGTSRESQTCVNSRHSTV